MASKATTIWLIRHAKAGQPAGVAEPDWPLTPEGRRQAHALASFLDGQDIGHIYVSPYLRAQQTLAPTSELTGHIPVILDDLRERCLAAEPIDDFIDALRDSFFDEALRLPGGETLAECRNRISSAINNITSAHPGQTIAVCSHGAAIASLISGLDRVDGFGLWQGLRNPHLIRLTIRNGKTDWRDFGGEENYASQR